MKYLRNGFLTVILTCPIMLFGQVTMNIHMSSGIEHTIDILDIDSITFTDSPPPELLNIFGISGNLHLVLYDIDSITYTISEITGMLIETNQVTNIGGISATSGGTIIDAGGYDILMKGVVWGLHPNPVLGQNYTADGSGIDSFNSSIVGLAPNTIYYLRAYAYTDQGVAYGQVESFETQNSSLEHLNENINYEFLQDIDGNTYHTVTIGNREWMAENLRVSKYANGDSITHLSYNSDWANTTSGAWSNYDNNLNNDYPRGKLYNSYAINDSRGVCPAGWRIPRNHEFIELISNVASASDLTSLSPLYWNEIWPSLTNSSGFSILGSGIRLSSGSFSNVNVMTDFYMETYRYDTIDFISGEVDTTFFSRQLDNYFNNPELNLVTSTSKNGGSSVRCIKEIEGVDKVTGTIVDNVTSNSADISSNLQGTPLDPNVEVGFTWVSGHMYSSHVDPILTDNVENAVLSGTNFSIQLTGLSPNTRYYIRAYSNNLNGVDYGPVFTFLTAQ